jgi:hypothetical protein
VKVTGKKLAMAREMNIEHLIYPSRLTGVSLWVTYEPKRLALVESA